MENLEGVAVNSSVPELAVPLLNGICPYFTMFPLDFPQAILKEAKHGDLVLDPFCGRGTTNFAARQYGLESVGVDASPVAVAITESKLVRVEPNEIIAEAKLILSVDNDPVIPQGEFWHWAYESSTLRQICKIREALLESCDSSVRKALRGIMLGALHGPIQKKTVSYFSNQCPRTYAPKPRYAVGYWKERSMLPPVVDVLGVISRRSVRYFNISLESMGVARVGDSQNISSLVSHVHDKKFSWIITSPPYYGMKTYIPDQWLRNWFVGGADVVQYEHPDQLKHGSPDRFSEGLNTVWKNVAHVSESDAQLVIRFGGISDRKASPIEIIKQSLMGSGWHINEIRDAGVASLGKRQADHFLKSKSNPVVELDVWAYKR